MLGSSDLTLYKQVILILGTAVAQQLGLKEKLPLVDQRARTLKNLLHVKTR